MGFIKEYKSIATFCVKANMSFSFLFSGYGRVREDDEDSDDDGSDEEIDESLVRIPCVGKGRGWYRKKLKGKQRVS